MLNKLCVSRNLCPENESTDSIFSRWLRQLFCDFTFFNFANLAVIVTVLPSIRGLTFLLRLSKAN